MFTPELERGFRRMFYKSMYKEYPTEDDLMHCKQKDTTTPLETAPEDTAADVPPDIAIEIKPKADENTVRRVLANRRTRKTSSLSTTDARCRDEQLKNASLAPLTV